MIVPTYQNITVEQYQKVVSISEDKFLDDTEKYTQLVGVLYNLTEEEVDNLTVNLFKQYAGVISNEFFSKPIPKPTGKRVDFIKANGKEYKIDYDIKNMRIAQFKELAYWLKDDDVVGNLHLILASIVDQVKSTWYFKVKVIKNDSKNHESISNDMLKLKFIDVYSVAVFFCHLFTALLKVKKDYLIKELMKKGMPETEINTLVNSSLKIMDGFIVQSE